LICRSAGGTPTNEHHVLVGIGVVDQTAPRGVREDTEEVGFVLDAQRLSRPLRRGG
jgi:hypothetical protein